MRVSMHRPVYCPEYNEGPSGIVPPGVIDVQRLQNHTHILSSQLSSWETD
jgi:hypothetical protein